MGTYLAWVIAGVSTLVCLTLWFREVGRVMRERKSTVDSAAAQLEICRRRVAQSMEDEAAAAVLARSEDIYRQAVAQYHRQLQRPFIRLPAAILGYGEISPEDTDSQGGRGV